MIHWVWGATINQQSEFISLAASSLCPACNAAARSLYYRDKQWHLFTCAACGLIYLDPMPGPDMLAALYYNAYDDAQTGYFAKPDAKLRRSLTRLHIIRRYIKTGSGNFLDVGCSGGFMVEAARRAGFTAWGIEPDRVSLDYARKHFPDNQYFHGLIADFDPRDASGGPIRFDVVYCSEVIEHVPQPQDFLNKIYQRLLPGGLLYLTTPDISHWRRPRKLADWDGFCPPSHVLYFNPKSLFALVQRCGFELVNRRPAWKPGIKLVLRRPV